MLLVIMTSYCTTVIRKRSPQRHRAFNNADRWKCTFTRKINMRWFLTLKTVNFPRTSEIWLFSGPLFSGIPRRKGRGARQNGDNVNDTSKSPNPWLKIPGEESTGGVNTQEQCGRKSLFASIRGSQRQSPRYKGAVEGLQLPRAGTSLAQGNPHPNGDRACAGCAGTQGQLARVTWASPPKSIVTCLPAEATESPGQGAHELVGEHAGTRMNHAATPRDTTMQGDGSSTSITGCVLGARPPASSYKSGTPIPGAKKAKHLGGGLV